LFAGGGVVSAIDGLLGAILGAPALPGARCRGRPHLFDEPGGREDPAVVAARQAQALGLCGRCPALAACSAWFESLPPRERPGGVIAGRVHTWGTTTRRREAM